MAAILGLQQRLFSKFRITTNVVSAFPVGIVLPIVKGIDIQAYAQASQNIIRSSCVGCGICSAVFRVG
jgi:formate hydrogenlyase subunit 6/NADH:ubiquinone oxidoreductase subunit I